MKVMGLVTHNEIVGIGGAFAPHFCVKGIAWIIG